GLIVGDGPSYRASIDFLFSRLGGQQLKAIGGAVTGQRGGGYTDPADGARTSSAATLDLLSKLVVTGHGYTDPTPDAKGTTPRPPQDPHSPVPPPPTTGGGGSVSLAAQSAKVVSGVTVQLVGNALAAKVNTQVAATVAKH